MRILKSACHIRLSCARIRSPAGCEDGPGLLQGALGSFLRASEELWKRFFARTVLRLALRICTTFSRRVACACRNIEELLLSAVTALVEAVNCDMITELEIRPQRIELEEQQGTTGGGHTRATNRLVLKIEKRRATTIGNSSF